MTIRYLSLFSGIGGFDLGFDRAGMECAGQVEYDAAARSAPKRHWQDVPRMNDVREVQGYEFGTVDLIGGGFPCQDVSVAGRAARDWLESGLDCGLSSIALSTPLNRELSSSKTSPVFYPATEDETLPSSFAGWSNAGMASPGGFLTLSNSGVAQPRRRIFIVGSLGNGTAASAIFDDAQHRAG